MLTCSSSLISKASGILRVTAFQNDADAAALHAHRNALAALVSAAYVDVRSDLRGARAAYAALPHLRTRTREYRRPLTNDELILCRLHALHLILSGNPTERRNGAAYVVGEDSRRPRPPP